MATQNGHQTLPVFVKDTIGEAQKRLSALEKEAQKLAKEFITRSRAAQKDFTRELEKIQKRGSEIIDDPRIREFRGRAREFSGDILGRLEELQSAILNLVGVASKEQVDAVSGELRRLAKKVDGMSKTARRSKPEGSVAVS